MSICSVTNQCIFQNLSRTEQSVNAYEIHVTAEVLALERQAEFRAACREAKVKALIIDVGDHLPRQPMTCLRVQGTTKQAFVEGQRVSQALKQAGFAVTHVKIEAAPWNDDLPTDGSGYYEHHARLALSNVEVEEPILSQFCKERGVHLSRNPFKILQDGSQQRFITLRHPPTTPEQAQQRANQLWQDLQEADFHIEKTVTEFCIYDNNYALDAGWA